jgi:hypothetical protein
MIVARHIGRGAMRRADQDSGSVASGLAIGESQFHSKNRSVAAGGTSDTCRIRSAAERSWSHFHGAIFGFSRHRRSARRRVAS